MPRKESEFWEKYCTNVVKINSDMRSWNCKFCGKEGRGTKTRMIAHVGHISNKGANPCLAATPELIQEAKVEAGVAYEAGIVSNIDMDVSSYGMELPLCFGHGMESAETSPSESPASPVYSSDRTPVPKRTQLQTKLKGRSVLTMKRMEHAMEMQVRCFVEANLSFNLLKLPCWIKMIEAFSQIGETCTGVSYTAMRTSRLKKTLADVTAKCDHVKATWPKYGCTIMFNRWVDVCGRGLINIIVSSAYGAMFLKIVDCSGVGISIEGEWLAEKMKEAIIEVGKENVVQIVTDNASNCRAMGKIIEKEFPTIVRTPCASHCLDLLLEDIGNLDWVKNARSKANTITLFFKKRKSAKSIFRHFSPELTMLRPSKTRFGVVFIVIQRLIRLWPALQQTVVSDFWRNWNDSKTPEAKTVQNYILDPTTKVAFDCVVSVMEPLYHVLRLTDIEGCTMGLLYEFMQRCEDVLKGGQESDIENKDKYIQVLALFETRWTWFKKPIHIVAHLLHPLWRRGSSLVPPALMEGMITYISAVYSVDESVKLLEQFHAFRNNASSMFMSPLAQTESYQAKPVSWWEHFGGYTPELQKLALRVLSQDCSSGACERSWSAHALAHTKRRNRLKPAQLERLIFIRENLRLMSKFEARAKSAKQVNPLELTRTDPSTFSAAPIDVLTEQESELVKKVFEESTASRRMTRSQSRSQSRLAAAASTSAATRRTCRRWGRGRGRGRAVMM